MENQTLGFLFLFFASVWLTSLFWIKTSTKRKTYAAALLKAKAEFKPLPLPVFEFTSNGVLNKIPGEIAFSPEALTVLQETVQKNANWAVAELALDPIFQPYDHLLKSNRRVEYDKVSFPPLYHQLTKAEKYRDMCDRLSRMANDACEGADACTSVTEHKNLSAVIVISIAEEKVGYDSDDSLACRWRDVLRRIPLHVRVDCLLKFGFESLKSYLQLDEARFLKYSAKSGISRSEQDKIRNRVLSGELANYLEDLVAEYTLHELPGYETEFQFCKNRADLVAKCFFQPNGDGTFIVPRPELPSKPELRQKIMALAHRRGQFTWEEFLTECYPLYPEYEPDVKLALDFRSLLSGLTKAKQLKELTFDDVKHLPQSWGLVAMVVEDEVEEVLNIASPVPPSVESGPPVHPITPDVPEPVSSTEPLVDSFETFMGKSPVSVISSVKTDDVKEAEVSITDSKEPPPTLIRKPTKPLPVMLPLAPVVPAPSDLAGFPKPPSVIKPLGDVLVEKSTPVAPESKPSVYFDLPEYPERPAVLIPVSPVPSKLSLITFGSIDASKSAYIFECLVKAATVPSSVHIGDLRTKLDARFACLHDLRDIGKVLTMMAEAKLIIGGISLGSWWQRACVEDSVQEFITTGIDPSDAMEQDGFGLQRVQAVLKDQYRIDIGLDMLEVIVVGFVGKGLIKPCDGNKGSRSGDRWVVVVNSLSEEQDKQVDRVVESYIRGLAAADEFSISDVTSSGTLTYPAAVSIKQVVAQKLISYEKAGIIGPSITKKSGFFVKKNPVAASTVFDEAHTPDVKKTTNNEKPNTTEDLKQFFRREADICTFEKIVAYFKARDGFTKAETHRGVIRECLALLVKANYLEETGAGWRKIAVMEADAPVELALELVESQIKPSPEPFLGGMFTIEPLAVESSTETPFFEFNSEPVLENLELSFELSSSSEISTPALLEVISHEIVPAPEQEVQEVAAGESEERLSGDTQLTAVAYTAKIDPKNLRKELGFTDYNTGETQICDPVAQAASDATGIPITDHPLVRANGCGAGYSGAQAEGVRPSGGSTTELTDVELGLAKVEADKNKEVSNTENGFRKASKPLILNLRRT